MENLNIIKSPLITEKASYLSQKENKYVFKVDKKANKYEIKKAIENAFGVKVESINTLITKPKDKRVGKHTGKTKTFKKAIVVLKDGDRIDV